jgi:hypothetical protein
MIRHAGCSATVVECFGLASPVTLIWQADTGEPSVPAVTLVNASGVLVALRDGLGAVVSLAGCWAIGGRQPNRIIVLARLNRATDARGNFLTAFCIVISFCKDRAIAAARVIVLGDLLQAAKKRWPSAGEDYSVEEKRR